MSAYSTISLFTISPPTNPRAIWSNPMEENQLRPRSVEDRTRSMPTGFLPNPVSPTRRPSGQTRWKKTGFALARLRPNSEYADGLLTESRLDNPKAIGSNPMEENRLRPRSVEDRTRSMPTGFSPNPVSPTRRPSGQTRWRNQLRPRSVETELRLCRRASY